MAEGAEKNITAEARSARSFLFEYVTKPPTVDPRRRGSVNRPPRCFQFRCGIWSNRSCQLDPVGRQAGVWDLIHFALLDWLARHDQIDWSRAVVDSCSVRADGRTPERRTTIGTRLTTALHRLVAWRRSEADRCDSDLPEWLEEVSERELPDFLSKFHAIAACGPEVDAGIDAGVGVLSSGL